jgi:hypothetical protein
MSPFEVVQAIQSAGVGVVGLDSRRTVVVLQSVDDQDVGETAVIRFRCVSQRIKKLGGSHEEKVKRHSVTSATVVRVRIHDERAGPPSSPIDICPIVDIHRPTTTTTTAAGDVGGSGCGGGGGGGGGGLREVGEGGGRRTRGTPRHLSLSTLRARRTDSHVLSVTHRRSTRSRDRPLNSSLPPPPPPPPPAAVVVVAVGRWISMNKGGLYASVGRF